MTIYNNIPPDALGDDEDDDMDTQELTEEDIRNHLANTPPKSVYLDKNGLPRRNDDRHNHHLMRAADSAIRLIGVGHLLTKIAPEWTGGGAPTRIRATKADPEYSIDISRVYNSTSGKPETKVDINQPRPEGRWEKLRAEEPEKLTLERRKDIDPEAEASQAKTKEEKRKKRWWE